MRILLCHNHYQRPGGEDQVFDDETRLLIEHGHDVERFTKHNDELRSMSRLGAALRAVWNGDTYRELRRVVARFKPAVVHFTNTFPLISPAAYYAVRAERVPVVQTLHNFRILCPNALLLRDGAACEACVGRAVAWPSIVHGCYRDSRLASAAVATVAAAHRAIGTWTLAVDRYIALSEFARQRFIAGGLPAGRITVKPNCVHPDPGRGAGDGGHFVFVGRLSPEKGLNVLLDAWSRLSAQSHAPTQTHAASRSHASPRGGDPRPITLEILGDGPLADDVRRAAAADSRIRWLGQRPMSEVLERVGSARGLLLPSLCYENCPKTLLEAFALGTPVVASRVGALAEMVDDRVTGRLFDVGDGAALARTIEQFVDETDDAARNAAYRDAARAAFETRYAAERNYAALMAVYESVGVERTAGAEVTS